MEEILQEHKVYIKINEESEVIDVNSSVFIKNFEDFIEIDSGLGDKYAHAQNNYFPLKLVDMQGRYNYKYVNREVVKVTF